jgi:hypothetical protein
MARDKRVARGLDEPQAQQEEMTVIVLKFKGGSQSLQKGFDAVSQALSTLGSGPLNNHSVVQRQPQHLPSAEGQAIEAESQKLPEEAAADDPSQEVSVSGTGKAKKPPSASKYTFNNDFNMSPDGVPSLKDYCTEKDPRNEQDKFLVASAWIQTHGGAEPFTGQHLFTCFRAMDWKTQADMIQPLRNLKSKKSYYDKVGRGEWKLTGIGLEAVENIKKE